METKYMSAIGRILYVGLKIQDNKSILYIYLDVRCGEETRVVPRLLQMRSHWMKSQKESLRLQEAGQTYFLLDRS